MTWLELSVDVDPEAVESISELLSQHGYGGGVVIDQPIIPGEDGPEYTYDTNRPVTVRTYLPVDEHTDQKRTQIEQALWHLGRMRPVGPLRAQPIEEQDWAEAWKRYYTIQAIGKRTVIVPSWLEYASNPSEIIIHLDPGMAFGTGLHPTTRLCLALLEDYVKPGMEILDLGCGSGILAIAAAHHGAGPIHAVDTDPIAVEATIANAERNSVAHKIIATEGTLGSGAMQKREGFELIVANILARVLAGLAVDLQAALAPGAVLISSGIIAEREDEVALAYAAAGLTRIERRQEGDWIALVHTR